MVASMRRQSRLDAASSSRTSRWRPDYQHLLVLAIGVIGDGSATNENRYCRSHSPRGRAPDPPHRGSGSPSTATTVMMSDEFWIEGGTSPSPLSAYLGISALVAS